MMSLPKYGLSIALMLPLLCLQITVAQSSTDWPAFRGSGANGVASGFAVKTNWNADPEKGSIEGILWESNVPGLGHSSPVIFGNKLFLLTAISRDGSAKLELKAGGKPTAADDNGQHDWVILCYDKHNGKELWRKTAYSGTPKATRHTKATHANTSVCVDGENVLAFFGSEGLYCYDLDGNLKWSRDLGVINISKYGIGWGFASSPTIFKDRVAIVCDDPNRPFVSVLRLDDGKDVWTVDRKDICERSWGTPMIHTNGDDAQVIINGWPWIVSYDLGTGKENWRIEGGGDNPVPTPFEANGWIYITNAHGGKSPIYVVRPDGVSKPTANTNSDESNAKRDSPIEPNQSNESNATKATGHHSPDLVWSVERGGSYMSTPVVYEDHLYLANSNGIIRCFHAKTGEKIFEKRIGKRSGFIASLVATDGKVFCASEDGNVYVLKAGPEFELLSTNSMGEPCLASPAISSGVLYFRTIDRLIAIQKP